MDSGIAHALLGLGSTEQLLRHPIAGSSWEGFVIETLIAASPDGTEAKFYRTAAGAEIDLLLTPPGEKPWAIEIKRSLSPKLEKGFYLACEDLQPPQRIVVYPGREAFALPNNLTAQQVAFCLRDSGTPIRYRGGKLGGSENAAARQATWEKV